MRQRAEITVDEKYHIVSVARTTPRVVHLTAAAQRSSCDSYDYQTMKGHNDEDNGVVYEVDDCDVD